MLGVKAHSLTQLAPQLKPLIGESTTVVSTQNGVPWWYFEGVDRPGIGAIRLERVDPGGVIAQLDRLCGAWSASIVYLSTDIPEPGVIRHTEGNRISLGEPDGSRSDRVRAIAEALVKAGLRCPVTARIRQEIWVKLLGNVAFNPISALTRATLAGMVRDPDVAALVRNIMIEVEAVATSWASSCRSRSTSASPEPEKWASTKLRCCRISKPGAPWNSKRWSARWSNWASA